MRFKILPFSPSGFHCRVAFPGRVLFHWWVAFPGRVIFHWRVAIPVSGRLPFPGRVAFPGRAVSCYANLQSELRVELNLKPHQNR